MSNVVDNVEVEDVEVTDVKPEGKAKEEPKADDDKLTLSQSELDRMIQQAILKREQNIRTKVEAEIEQDKLTTEQQLEQLRQELALEKSKVRAEKELVALELEDDDTEALLEMLVDTDEEKTVERAKFLSELVNAKVKSAIDKHVKDAMTSTKKPADQREVATGTAAERHAKQISESLKGGKDKVSNILDQYTS